MRPSDFRAFFDAVHFAGESSPPGPFPWQQRLAEQVCADGVWPEVLDIPTGAGKTACIDVALFHWLVSASRKEPWVASRRIAFVVDRRIVVDEAAQRARKIADMIASAKGGILADARELVRANTDELDEGVVNVFTLRGGVARERNLARDPLSVSVVLSTVDQLGSRLLFRGYGVSERMRSIHAGLFGVDTLLLLDEAHIAEPFVQTLEAIVREQSAATAKLAGPRPLHWARLSATPSASVRTHTQFYLAKDDRTHPVLKHRLVASKPMRLIEVAKRDELPATFAKLVAEELTLPPLSDTEQPRIGLVVNRISTARAVFETLRKNVKDRADVELLIGRVRPLDRDRILSRLGPLLKSSSKPRPGERPVVLVATQTIEVGADFDFHSLFIEAASYSAVKQRVGRLNRLGLRKDARGAIVCVEADAKSDPVYQDSICATWKLLRASARNDVVDLGIERAPDPASGTSLEPPSTPVLSPSLLDLLVQTCPEPADGPDPAELLHGFFANTPDVSIVWRAGLEKELTEHDEAVATAAFRVLPPLSTEAMSLPYPTFRQWASSWSAESRKIVDGGDLEGDDGGAVVSEPSPASVLVVDADGVQLVRADQVRPGALIVLPAKRGGADEHGWNPDAPGPVPDLTLLARNAGLTGVEVGADADRHEQALVWTPEAAKAWLGPDSESAAIESFERLFEDPDATLDALRTEAEGWFENYGDKLPFDVRATYSMLLDNRGKIAWLETPEGVIVGFSLREGRVRRADLIEQNLQSTVRVRLDEHLRGVGKRAQLYARRVGLDAGLVDALRVAGDAHDLGKADPRFQRRLGAAAGELLAKSDTYDESVPRGERHEAYSVAILDRHPELIPKSNEHHALIRYLVGSHHGYGRAAHPVVADGGVTFEACDVEGRALPFSGRPALYRLDGDWSDLFMVMNRKYGAWMLAYLESILRLADHRTSEWEIKQSALEKKHNGKGQ